MKRYFFYISLPIIAITLLWSLLWAPILWLFIIVGPLFLLGIYDILQRKHTILRNFPVIGHMRFILEAIRPEMYQYFVESDWEGRPFNRMQRSVIYQRAKGAVDTNPYGTRKDVLEVGYEWMNHSINAHFITENDPRVMVGGDDCKQPYNASILNISAMSFGALSKNAILALNKGAKTGGFYHNTGEGGLSPYHLEYGGDVVWQIGTGYFGCRKPDGTFCEETFVKSANKPSVKMIEIKISQGAKPGHGGILPAAKVSAEIANIRHVPRGEDVISPPGHSAFSTPIELLEYVARLRELTKGKPIGFKLCIGIPHEFLAICKAMLQTGILPDFITVDGGEGGTGAAPLEFSNAVGAPISDALPFVHNALMGIGVRDKIRIIASGKLITGFEILSKFAMGADMANNARPMMMALGCVQSLKCNTNACPTGVATQDPALAYGLVVEQKYKRVARYHKEAVKAVMELVGAAGLDHPQELRPWHVFRRLSKDCVKSFYEIYGYLDKGDLLKDDLPPAYADAWNRASADHFGRPKRPYDVSGMIH